jgi:hypothetical protein
MSSLQALANESYSFLPPGARPDGIPQLNSGLDDILSGSAKLAKARNGSGLGGAVVGSRGGSVLRSSTAVSPIAGAVDAGA